MSKKRRMTLARAIAIANKSMDREYQILAVASNLFEKYGLDDAPGRTASKRREQIREAKKVLEELLDEKK